MKKQIFIIAIIISQFYSCAIFSTRYHTASYDITLIEVEKSEYAKEKYGMQKITKSEEKENEYFFEDDMIEIFWILGKSNIHLVLKNKTDHSIKIIWDDAAFVDIYGESQRIMHSGIKYIDKNDSQIPTVIVRKENLSDIIIPTENIYLSSGSSWREKPFLPMKDIIKSRLEENANAYIGKKIQILLPLKIEDIINEYIFIFEIKSVIIK